MIEGALVLRCFTFWYLSVPLSLSPLKGRKKISGNLAERTNVQKLLNNHVSGRNNIFATTSQRLQGGGNGIILS